MKRMAPKGWDNHSRPYVAMGEFNQEATSPSSFPPVIVKG